MTDGATEPGVVPPEAQQLFGENTESAARFVDLLAERGVERGVIGPREIDRLWGRHVLNSAVLAELIPAEAIVVDVGSGGGFPGVPLALARPDIEVTLLEPMARRIQWLTEVVDELGLTNVVVVRGRAEEKTIRTQLGEADIVTARAVAPLARLAEWCLPLVRAGGLLLALKGASAAEEVQRDASTVRKVGGESIDVVQCGVDVVETPTTVVVIEAGPKPKRTRSRRRRR